MPTLPHHAGPRAIAEKRAREAFFASLSRELRCSLDDDGRFLLLEGAWQSVLGWRPERLYGWHWQEVVHPTDREALGEALSRVQEGGEREREIEVRLALATGGYRSMEWTLVAGSGPDSVLGVGRLRTEPAEDRAELERRNAELAARVEDLQTRYTAMERFAAVAAHQVSEPLIVAESSAIMLEEELAGDLDPALSDRLDAIGRSAARARRLVDGLLAEARAAERPPSLRSVDASVLVAQTIAALRPRMEDRRVTAVAGEMPTLETEPSLLSIILENLISNAIKYGPRSGGDIVVSSRRVSSGWEFSVQSDGAPIDDEQARRIFEPFRRAVGERRASGSGLGLTICTRLVERLGGSIGVRPAEGGNVFYFVLPDGD